MIVDRERYSRSTSRVDFVCAGSVTLRDYNVTCHLGRWAHLLSENLRISGELISSEVWNGKGSSMIW